ncbi:trichohyalin-like isoform X2 [Pomacea canaliculata]|uniref:trichohyalin-like isoform X2 n=1 Tax=Pomacea canaliculata TaxID=400727 RepID=UPI000D72FB0D|nr:trichohyalin-like isoform X2 [Pomacea canaliculata]
MEPAEDHGLEFQDSFEVANVEISHRLQAEGLSSQCDEGEKLMYIWRLYKKLEGDLHKAQESEEKLKEAQTEEMREVENYVEHIRHLSEERETLIQELETENEQLKLALEQLHPELSDEAQKEAAEMLTQQGLAEIAMATPSEQVAYLLVERARLLDELESLQTKPSQTDAHEGSESQELKDILEKERKELEQALTQQRESATFMKEKLRQEHEEEISALMDENTKLEDELAEVKRQVTQLEAQIHRLKKEHAEEQDLLEEERGEMVHERDVAVKEKKIIVEKFALLKKAKEEAELKIDSLEKERETWRESSREVPSSPLPSPSPMRSSNDVALRKVIEEKTKVEGEIITLRTEIRLLRNEKENQEEEAKRAKGEREKLQVTIQQLQLKNKNLRQELEDVEGQLEEAETAAEEAKKSQEEVQKKYEELLAEVKTLRTEAQRCTTLQDITDILTNEKEQLTSTLDKVRVEMKKVLEEKDILSSQNLHLTLGEQELTKQVASLREELFTMEKERDEVFIERDELLTTQNTREGMLSSLRMELSSVQDFSHKASSMSEQLIKEKTDLEQELKQTRNSLETAKHAEQELAKQELIVSHLKEQNANLNDQLTKLQSQLEWARTTEKSFIDAQQSAQRAHVESEKRMAGEVDDLRLKLQHALTELQALKTSYEQESAQRSSLSQQLSLTESRLLESAEVKNNLDKERMTRAELELKNKDLERKLADKTRIADSFETERMQRIELERKIMDLVNNHSVEVQELQSALEREKNQRCTLELKIQELEQLLDDVKGDSETVQQSMKVKITSLEKRVQALQDDLFSAQDELQTYQQKYEESLREAEVTRSEFVKQQEYAQQQQLQFVSEAVSMEELKSSLESTSTKLQVVQNELNIANTRVLQLEEQCASDKVDLRKFQTEAQTLKFQREVDAHKLQEMENSLKSLKRDLSESQSVLMQTTSQLQNKQIVLDSVKHEMDALNHELERVRESTRLDLEEKSQHTDKLRMQELKIRQLEQEKKDMIKKLSDFSSQCEELKEKLKNEKDRNTDSYHQRARYVEQLELDLAAANKHIRSLREELQQHQSSVFKLQADTLGQSAKFGSTVARLEAELKEVRDQHKRETDSLQERLSIASTESREAKNEAIEKEQIVTDLRREALRTQSTIERLQAQLLSQSKTHAEMENRNTTLEHEMTKVWSQVRMLREHNAVLENKLKVAEEELDRKSVTMKHLETSVSEKDSAFQRSLREWQNRAEVAEKRARQLEQEVSAVNAKEVTVEKQLQKVELSQVELHDKSKQLASIRNQLEGEKLQRTLLEQTVAELKHQVSLLKQRENKAASENKELQHTIIDLQSRLSCLQDNSGTAFQTQQHQKIAEVGRQNLMDQISGLQHEVKSLKYELMSSGERRDLEFQHYEERKQRTKAKLMKARETFTSERSKYHEHMQHMDEDLEHTRAALRKELEWKEKMDKNYKHLLQEKRELITQMTEQEEIIRDKSRSLSVVESRISYLENENRHLQKRVDSLTSQKQTLDKLVKDFQQNRDLEFEERIQSGASAYSGRASSGHDSSEDISWEQEQAEDGSLLFRQGSSFYGTSVNQQSHRYEQKTSNTAGAKVNGEHYHHFRHRLGQVHRGNTNAIELCSNEWNISDSRGVGYDEFEA